jgi:hypothetical protein
MGNRRYHAFKSSKKLKRAKKSRSVKVVLDRSAME